MGKRDRRREIHGRKERREKRKQITTTEDALISMEKQLKAMNDKLDNIDKKMATNMATKGDLSAIYQRLVRIDRNLAALEESERRREESDGTRSLKGNQDGAGVTVYVAAYSDEE